MAESVKPLRGFHAKSASTPLIRALGPLWISVKLFAPRKDGTAWQGFGIEVYVTVGAIYFVFCFAMSKYSQNLEAELNRHRRR